MVQNMLRIETAVQEGASEVFITANWKWRKLFPNTLADAQGKIFSSAVLYSVSGEEELFAFKTKIKQLPILLTLTYFSPQQKMHR